MSQEVNYYFAIATIFAVILGPILAVIVTRIIDAHREKRRRQWDIFRNLMCYRLTPLNPEYVGALNLIEVEFSKDQQILHAWRKLLECFNNISKTTVDNHTNLMEERNRAQAILLDTIARRLGLKIEQLDIYHGGYSPQGWIDLENEQAAIRRLFGEIAIGRRGFPVTTFPERDS